MPSGQPTPQQRIERLEDMNSKLRKALRGMAIKARCRRGKLAEVFAYRCRCCGGQWARGEDENHFDNCEANTL